jgi:hypothetical protein
MKNILIGLGILGAIVSLNGCKSRNREKTNIDTTSVVQYLSDTLGIPAKNITLCRSFFAEGNSYVFETVVSKLSETGDGYLPEHICGSYYVFLNDTVKLGFSRLENFQKFYEENNDYYFAGNTKFRGLGYLEVICFQSSSFKHISFDNVYILNNSLDCISYCDNDGYLIRQVRDLNDDKVPDFTFTGVECIYCDSLEYGYGRTDREPKTKKNITISFISYRNENSLSWRLNQ